MDTANKLESKQKQVQYLNEVMDANMHKNRQAMDGYIAAALKAAREKAEEVASILSSWGSEAGPGEQLEVNRQLLERVRSSEKLKGISRYLGRYRKIVSKEIQDGYAFGLGEKYDIELGNRISRLVSSEYALLGTLPAIPLFLRKYQRKTLKQYRRRDRISRGMGDIIICIDESDSTRGGQGTLGQGTGLCAAGGCIPERQERSLVHYSGKGSIKTDLFIHWNYTQEDVSRSAEFFLREGTDFETPLAEALRLMDTVQFCWADIVFITDGICRVAEAFMDRFLKRKTTMHFRVYGTILDKGSGGYMEDTIEPFCNSVY